MKKKSTQKNQYNKERTYTEKNKEEKEAVFTKGYTVIQSHYVQNEVKANRKRQRLIPISKHALKEGNGKSSARSLFKEKSIISVYQTSSL